MEMKAQAGNSKGQLMSIASLAFVMLMVSALLVFIVIGIGYNGISQSSVVATGAGTYGLVLQRSADSFATSSGTAALQALYYYSSNSVLRKGNFITNFSEDVSSLVEDGTLPGITPGSSSANVIKGYMSGSTLSSYNSIVAAATGTGSKLIAINESEPVVLQNSPYSISISYIETVTMNISSSIYSFEIPVNATIPLNNTPDLLYAQQGVYKPIVFANSSTTAKVVGGTAAIQGSPSGFVYGTAYVIASPTTCTISLPPPLGSAPYNSRIIIVTPDAYALTSSGCAALNSYGGLITYNSVNAPSIPYLEYTLSSNALQYMQTGQKLLLYGPALSTLNITGLVNAASSGDFFTSPFAPSYISRSADSLQAGSAYGMFDLPTVTLQAASFNGMGSSISTNYLQNAVTTYTIAAWVQTTANQGVIVQDRGSVSAESITFAIGAACGGPGTYCTGSEPGLPAIGVDSGGVWIGANGNYVVNDGKWHFLVGTFSAPSGSIVSSSDFHMYVDGALTSGNVETIGAPASPLTGSGGTIIGYHPLWGSYYNGIISNLQIYGNTLTPYQIQSLYQEGIDGLPLSNLSLAAWYPLDGNPNDYGGGGYSSTQNGISYGLLSNYTIDPVFPASTATTYPVPGLLSCNTNKQCFGSQLPRVYLSNLPLGVGTAGLSAASFSLQGSYITNNQIAHLNNQPVWTLAAWIYPENSNAIYTEGSPGQTFIFSAESNNGLGIDSWNNALPGKWMFAGSSANVITFNSWNFVAVTMSDAAGAGSGTAKFYSNGKFISSNTAQTESNTLSHYFGIGTNVGSLYGGGQSANQYSGYLANLQIYNSIFSAGQISQLYSEGITGLPVAPANIIGWYPLNGNAQDYSGLGNNGNTMDPGSYTLIQSIAPQSQQAQSANSIGISNISSINTEWQAFGFPAPT